MTSSDSEDLTTLDRAVLTALTTSRTTVGVVAIGATVGYSYDLLSVVITGLNEKGLLTYRKTPRTLIHDIRLTQKGWAEAGYPVMNMEVGRRMSAATKLEEKGDRTNHRTHRARAEGGPIETLSFPDHRAKYPDHIHPLMWEQGATDMGMKNSAAPQLAPVDEPRGYIKVTPELEARVVAYKTRFPLVDYTELAEMVGLPKRTVQYILTDLPRLRATNDGEVVHQGTIKQRILWVLDALDMDDVVELRRVLGRADTEHDIVHALHDLHKVGKVDFREDGPHKHPTNIHLTARGRGEGLPKSVKAEVEATLNPRRLDNLDGTTQVTVTDTGDEPVVEPEPAGYPLLDALLDREQKRQAQDNAGFKYLEAAEAIKDIDPVMYSALVSKADSSIPFPSPVEAEYLRYVADHD